MHDDVFNFCKKKCTRTYLVDSISAAIERRLTNETKCTFTKADTNEDGSYVPLPNVPISDVVEYGNTLETKVNRAVALTPPTVRQNTRGYPVIMESIRNEQLEEEMAKQAT